MANLTAMTKRSISDITHFIPPFWLRDVRDDIQHREYFAKGRFQGDAGSGMMVIQNDSFVSNPGNTVTVTIEGEDFSNGVEGETTLSGTEEAPDTNQFTVPILWQAHAEAITRQANDIAMVNTIIRAGGRNSRWAGKRRDELVWSELLDPAAGVDPTIVYAGDATTQATLSNTCTLSPDEIDKAKLAVEMQAKPMELADSVTGEILQKYVLIMDNFTRNSFFGNTVWRNAVQASLERGFSHPLYTGALGQWNDVVLRTYTQNNVGCHQGTPQRPEGVTYGANTTNRSADTELVIGDSTSKKVYTNYWPDTGSDKLMINVEGTVSTYDYTGLTDYSFTGCTLDGQADLNSDIADGARVTPYNHMSQLVISGSEAIMRAFKIGDKPLTNETDYKRNRGIGIEFANGCRVVEDSQGAVTGYIIMRVWAKTPKFSI